MRNLTPDQVERGRAFVKALRENDRKTIGEMRDDDDGGRCCLCVAYDTAQAMGAGLLESGNTLPPVEIKHWYGWTSNDPAIVGLDENGDEQFRSAHEWNDGENVPEKTHAEIADMFEAEFLQLKIEGVEA